MQSLSDFIARVIDDHVSIRKYRKAEIDDETLKKLIYMGNRAPSSANIQPYSIIAVRDEKLKKEIAALCGGQSHIEECSVFLLFAADYNRVIKAMEKLGIEPFQPNIYSLYVAAVDAALAAQNIALAAESMGYGICYIGAVQNNPCKMAELLGLPKHVYPLFGMTIGVPDETPNKRLRLYTETILHLERYEGDKADQVIKVYEENGYLESLKRRYSRYLSKGGRVEERNPHFIRCLEERGFKVIQ